MLPTEIATGEYDMRKYFQPTEHSLRNPPPPDPTDEQVSRDRCLYPQKHEENKFINTGCGAKVVKTSAADIRNPRFGAKSGRFARNVFGPILLIDSRAIYTAILRLHPKHDDKCAKIILNHIRDLLTLLRISYTDAPTNFPMWKPIMRVPSTYWQSS